MKPASSMTTHAPPDPALFVKAEVTQCRDSAPGIRILTIACAQAITHYRAGQYVWIGFGHFSPRPYSVAGMTVDGAFEIHIKDSGAGGASSYALRHLRPGENVLVSARTAGQSFYDPQHHGARALLCLAGGLGIAPMKAVVEAALQDPHRTQPVWLYWGAQQAGDLYLADYFRAMMETHALFRFKSVIGTPVGEIAMKDFENLSGYEVFLAGPQAMLEATVPLLRAQGVDPAALHYDRQEPGA